MRKCKHARGPHLLSAEIRSSTDKRRPDRNVLTFARSTAHMLNAAAAASGAFPPTCKCHSNTGPQANVETRRLEQLWNLVRVFVQRRGFRRVQQEHLGNKVESCEVPSPRENQSSEGLKLYTGSGRRARGHTPVSRMQILLKYCCQEAFNKLELVYRRGGKSHWSVSLSPADLCTFSRAG